MSCTRRGIGIAHRSGRRWPNRSSWMEGLVLGLLVAVPAVIAALSGYSAVRGSNAPDDDLTARLLNREQPQPLSNHSSYARPGAAVHFVPDDYRIKGQGFIPHEGTLEVAFLPY